MATHSQWLPYAWKVYIALLASWIEARPLIQSLFCWSGKWTLVWVTETHLRMASLRKYSDIKVNSSAAPENTKDQGNSEERPRQGLVRSSAASGRMCTKPVAMTTPPPKAAGKTNEEPANSRQSEPSLTSCSSCSLLHQEVYCNLAERLRPRDCQAQDI